MLLTVQHKDEVFETCRQHRDSYFKDGNYEKPCSSCSLQCSEDTSGNEEIELQLAINASSQDHGQLREESMTVKRLLNEHEPIRNLENEVLLCLGIYGRITVRER